VFENNTSPDEFYGSRIFWDGRGSWTVQMRDGWQYTIQGCSANVPIGPIFRTANSATKSSRGRVLGTGNAKVKTTAQLKKR
jgi:hypothetical protein